MIKLIYSFGHCVCVYIYIRTHTHIYIYMRANTYIYETCGLNLRSTYVFTKEMPFFTLET